MEIKPAKSVKLRIGATSVDNAPIPLTIAKQPLTRVQTATIRHHDSLVDLLDAHKLPTDGSQVILKPGTAEPFDWKDDIYSAVDHGTELLVVPNRPDQLGKDAVQAPHIPSKVAPALARPQFPKLLRDSTPAKRDDVLVHNASEEADARSKGFTVEIPAPQPKVIPAHPPLLAPSNYPKTLKDTTGAGRQNVVVYNEHQEGTAKSMGFTEEVPVAA